MGVIQEVQRREQEVLGSTKTRQQQLDSPAKLLIMTVVYLAILVSLSLASPEASPEALASPGSYASDYGYSPSSQYHAQDNLGQYNFGFTSPDQTKEEIKTADGVTRGAYSYVDANGILQTVKYISDALGFRVAATNLPVHDVASPDVAPVAVPWGGIPCRPERAQLHWTVHAWKGLRQGGLGHTQGGQDRGRVPQPYCEW